MSARTDLSVVRLVVGPMEVNCYIVYDPFTREACVIDPGSDGAKIKKAAGKEGLKIGFIINTHGHGDHIGANGDLGVPIYIHRLDAGFLRDPKKNLSAFFFFSIKSPEASRLLEDGDSVKLGSASLGVLHTPGHTPGSISLVSGGAVFTGDTLFRECVGRTDFEYGDEGTLMKSIHEKLMPLGDETAIYPGHGEASTIGHERESNPFLT